MTAIAGIVEDGRVWIGGDSAGVLGSSLQTRSDPKVFRKGEFIMGYTSSFRMGQILQFHLVPPLPFEGQNHLEYMVTGFVPAVMSSLSQHGFETTRDGQASGGTFLVGWRGELYQIDDDYQVARVHQDYFSCGCGTDIVLGSLHATSQAEVAPRDRIQMALTAAVEFSAAVRGPFEIISTE